MTTQIQKIKTRELCIQIPIHQYAKLEELHTRLQQAASQEIDTLEVLGITPITIDDVGQWIFSLGLDAQHFNEQTQELEELKTSIKALWQPRSDG